MAKYVCLSFDDGPNNKDNDSTMNDMLDILEEYNIPASFFLIGNKITAENTKVIRRAFEMGCDIENHSWTHSAMAEMTKDAICDEYDKCDKAIIDITGVKPVFFRPPYINVGPVMYEAIKTPFICGYGVEDWVPEVTAEERAKRMLSGVKDGTIFLLHVMEGNKATLDACKIVIPELKKQGYTFVNLPDLFRLENVTPNVPNSLWSFLK